MKSFILTIATIVLLASNARAGQFLSAYNLLSNPGYVVSQQHTALLQPSIIPAPNQPQDISHPAVVANSLAESQLPPQLLNDFYKNPHIAAGLAKESWFTNKEFPVHHREAEKISREQIVKLIRNLERRRR